MAQTKSHIRATLEAAGIAPLRRYGQNFLIDANLMGVLVAAADLRADDVVLEVGPGTGALTERLLEAAGHVVAVEIDRGLQQICRERFGASQRFTLIEGDVLLRKSEIAPAVPAALRARAAALGGRVMLVANLPYQVATPLVMDLLMGELRVSPLCFTVQAEVAARFTAAPGGRDYGPLSILTQALADVRRIARVPPEAFWPVPKVDSAMLRVDVHAEQPVAPKLRSRLASILHACFQHRRKTLRSNLRGILGEPFVAEIERAGKWNLEDRPERISVPAWIELAALVESRGADARPG
jgi:16S rRNA (adenine1518-N6/adenine1519-N6)-dimethyltransferase